MGPLEDPIRCAQEGSAAREEALPSTRISERFLIRDVGPDDLDALYKLSRFLNSVNFPHDREVLKSLILNSQRSFSGRIQDPFRRQYMFVTEGVRSGRLAGTSTIIAQHGHPDAPHTFFEVVDDHRYSATLSRHFNHVTLRIGLEYSGPTEIGALVIAPEFRALGLGRPLSYVRFLLIAMHRELFRSQVIAELMPPLEADGRSLLWEHLGKRFTGLTYQEADKLSQRNKEFIVSLFPQTPIQASLLPDRVRDLIGQVGDETRGVKKMLEEVGFEYSQRIDPFDGGPHFIAETERISLVRDYLPLQVSERVLPADQEIQRIQDGEPVEGVLRLLVASERKSGAPRFRATVAAGIVADGELELSEEARSILKLRAHSPVHVVPF